MMLSELLKIEDGTYGICKSDGKMIPIERFPANPAARTCMDHTNDLKLK